MKDDQLRAEETFSEAGLSTSKRVLETLRKHPDRMPRLTATALGLLMESLEQSGALTAKQIDDILIETI